MKHRLNITVDDATFQWLSKMRADCGYATVCRLVTSLLMLLLARSKRDTDSESIDEEVASMFAELGDAEAPRYGARCVRHNNVNRYGQG